MTQVIGVGFKTDTFETYASQKKKARYTECIHPALPRNLNPQHHRTPHHISINIAEQDRHGRREGWLHHCSPSLYARSAAGKADAAATAGSADSSIAGEWEERGRGRGREGVRGRERRVRRWGGGGASLSTQYFISMPAPCAKKKKRLSARLSLFYRVSFFLKKPSTYNILWMLVFN